MGMRYKIKDSLKRFDEFQKQGLIDLACDYGNDDPDNIMNCSKCGSKLGLWRMIYHAKGVKRGEYYYVKCKRCVHVNEIKRSVKK